MILGTNHTDYNRNRNIINLPFKKIEVKKVKDIFKIITHFYFKLFNKSHQLSLNSFNDFGLNKSDVNHFFNGISYSNTPWFVTFETSLPRYSNSSKFWIDKGVKRLAHSSCKTLIALSENAKQIQINYLKDKYPSSLDIISNKIQVLHPQQKLIVNKYSEKELNNNKIIFTLIGADFFRKGGLEVLRVFDKLKEENIDLNIISSMQFGDYASKATIEDLKIAKELIKSNIKINHFNTLPNTEVLELLKNSHIGLLPTYADTYGYSVLESQASGCPVISTNIRALPEINNNNVGWVIEVPKDKNGNGILKTEEDREKFSSIIEKELYRIIKDEILPNKEIIKQKGKKSLERTNKYHNPKDIAEVLEGIYRNALVGS